MSDKIVLPTKPVDAVLVEPGRMIVLGPPKIGKTVATALLPNALVLNFEDEKQTTSGMFMYIDSIDKLKAVCKAIVDAGKPYTFGVIDTITKLETLALTEAERLYRATSMGKNWINYIDRQGKVTYKHIPGETILNPKCGKKQYGDLLQIPKGAGYPWLTKAMKNIDQILKNTFPKLIYIAHLKETTYLNEDTGLEATSKDVNLTGKNKYVFSSDAHAIGYMVREGNKLYIEFQPSEDLVSGCKVDRLDGRKILISEKNDQGKVIAHWDEIYISLKEKTQKK